MPTSSEKSLVTEWVQGIPSEFLVPHPLNEGHTALWRRVGTNLDIHMTSRYTGKVITNPFKGPQLPIYKYYIEGMEVTAEEWNSFAERDEHNDAFAKKVEKVIDDE